MKSTIIITLFISLLFFLKINNTLNCFDRKTKSEISFCSDKSDFSDYYKSIDVIDVSNIFGQLMEVLVGSFSFEAKLGFGEVDESNKFLLLLQRILGLCFDNVREIDVGGTAKVSE